MLKRIISIALAVVMVMAMAAVAVSAAEVSDASAGAEVSNSAGADTSSSATGSGSVIYFDASKWKNYTTIYCHIWERGGDAFFTWQSKKEACTKVSGSKYSYDLSTLDASTQVEGGFKSNKDYCVIFSANTGVQTFDQTIGTACIGDTAKVTGKMIENAVDSEKEAYESVWTTNSSKYGPHLAISSIGNIIGSKLCPNENGAEVIGDWLPTYSSHTNFDVVATLAKALPKFGVKDIQTVYAYILSKENSDLTDSDYATMQSQLEKAYAKAYPSAKAVKIDKAKAKTTAKAIEGGKSVESVSSDSTSSSSSSGTGSTSSTSSTNSSGSGSDGQNDTILFILGGVMVVAAGAMFMSRRKREE
jgi:LPXTG-motif cell wall-anchored protein